MNSYDIPDHPVVRNCERTGYPDGNTPQEPVCPVCGEACCTAYVNEDLDIVGCDECCEMVFPEDLERPDFVPDTNGNYTCPVCGRLAEMVAIRTKTKEIVGCDQCVRRPDAWEQPEFFK